MNTTALPEHGTTTRYYGRGCRCDECRAAATAYSNRYSHRPALASDCVGAHGRTSKCADIAGRLARAQGHLGSIARKANRSEAAFRRWSTDLGLAKTDLAEAKAELEQHLAECPAVVARFSKT